MRETWATPVCFACVKMSPREAQRAEDEADHVETQRARMRNG